MIPSFRDRLRASDRPRLGPRRARASHDGRAQGLPAALLVVRHAREPPNRTGVGVPRRPLRPVLRVFRRLQAGRDFGNGRAAGRRPGRLPVVWRLRRRMLDRRSSPGGLRHDRVARAPGDRARHAAPPSVGRRGHVLGRRAAPAGRVPPPAARGLPGARDSLRRRYVRGGLRARRRPRRRCGGPPALRPQAPGR